VSGEPIPITEAVEEILGRPMVSAVSEKQLERKKIRECRQVFINEADKGKPLPLWRPVARGVHGGVRILYTDSIPCILTPATKVVYSKACRYGFRELESNIVLEEDCGTGRKHLYAYPKRVWDELYKFYVKPMTEGEDPFNVGVILMGPPGTGKSRLAQIIANYAGINTFKVDTTILSKWVGESEDKLRDVIMQARAGQPSIIILDDAEWLLMSRSLARGTADEGMASVRLNLQQILFDKMQEIYDRRERVLFIATTNMKQEVLDQALVRHGRFGPPIFIPLPDLEATKLIVSDILPDRDEDEIEEIAFKAVNAGLSVADVIAVAEKVRRGGEAKPKTVGGRGYKRIYVDRVGEFGRLEKDYHIPVTKMLSAKSRLSILGNEDIATAFAVQIAYASGKTVIKLVDSRYLDEAIHSANMLGSVFIAPTKLSEEIQYYINDNADVPVVFVGERRPFIEAFPLGDIRYIIGKVGVKPSVRAVLAYKGLRGSNVFYSKVERKAYGDYGKVERILKLIATTGIVEDEAFEALLSWMT